MDLSTAIRARLLTITAVTALVNARVWTGPVWPQNPGPTLPALKVLDVVSIETPQLKGSSGLLQALIQLDILASSRASALTVEAAIRGDGAGSALDFWSGQVGSPPLVISTVLPDGRSEDFVPSPNDEWRIMREYRVSFAR